ncbi:MAG: Mut7-C RNAse domain-containing protein [Candidatus Omnitrophota bacterium]|jgi:hypothetical protein
MKFLLTKELGRLLTWLRILGYDTEYFKGDKSGSLMLQALQDSRIIITRNHNLPQSRGVRIIVIKNEKLKEQVAELLKTLSIEPVSGMMFTRCTLCNTALKPKDKAEIKALVPEYVFQTQEKFFICEKCSRIYWQGTHWGKASSILKEIIG